MGTLKMVDIDITNRCNLNCKHCGASILHCKNRRKHAAEDKELPKAIIFNLLEQIASLGCRDITIAGGEPFVREDIFDVLKKANYLGLYVALLTNGTLIEGETAKKLGKLPYISYIRISVDYVDEEKLEEFRRSKGIFELIKRAIHHLKEEGILVGIGSTILPENLSQVEKLIEFSIEQGVDFIRMVPAVKIGRAGDQPIDFTFYVEAIKTVLTSTASHAKDLKQDFTQIPHDVKEISSFFACSCPGGKISCSVSPKGFVKICPLLPDSEEERFNVQSKNFSQIWGYLALEKETWGKKVIGRLRGRCGVCNLKSTCAGGCLAEKISRGLEDHEEQPICIRGLIEEALKGNISDPEVRMVLSGILNRQAINISYGIPPCVRSLPIWIYPLKSQ